MTHCNMMVGDHLLTGGKASINMRFVSATRTVTVRESSETGKGSEGVDPPAEGWVVSC